MFSILRVLTVSIYELYPYDSGSSVDGTTVAGILVILKGLLIAGYGLYTVCNAEEMVKGHLHWITDDEATPSEGAIMRNKVGGAIMIAFGVVFILLGIAFIAV